MIRYQNNRFRYCFRASQEKKPIKPMLAVDRENENEKRRKELREKQDVSLNKISHRNKSFYLGIQFSQRTRKSDSTRS